MSLNEKVTYLNGALSGLAALGAKTNYVPCFGAETISATPSSIKYSLELHLHPDKLTDFLPLDDWRKKFKLSIRNLVAENLDGANWYQYLDVIEECIMSNNKLDLSVFRFSSEGEKFDHTNAGYVFADDNAAFMTYFSYSD